MMLAKLLAMAAAVVATAAAPTSFCCKSKSDCGFMSATSMTWAFDKTTGSTSVAVTLDGKQPVSEPATIAAGGNVTFTNVQGQGKPTDPLYLKLDAVNDGASKPGWQTFAGKIDPEAGSLTLTLTYTSGKPDHVSLQACNAPTPPTPKTYDCVKGKCKAAAGNKGHFPSQTKCHSSCTAPTPPTPPGNLNHSYACDKTTGTCKAAAGNKGQFSSQAKCHSSCTAPTPPTPPDDGSASWAPEPTPDKAPPPAKSKTPISTVIIICASVAGVIILALLVKKCRSSDEPSELDKRLNNGVQQEGTW